MRHLGSLLALCLVVSGCGVELIEVPDRVCSATEPCQQGQVCRNNVCVDASLGTDGGVDAGTDAGTDAGSDAGTDAGTDAGSDAGTDAGVEILVEVTPSMVTLEAGETQRFTATVEGSDAGITWSILQGSSGGTIDAEGLYTAPALAHGNFQVLATSVEDAEAQGVATVFVAPPQPEISGLVAHYSASELLGKGQTLPAFESLVQSWVDLSGTGKNLSQLSAARQPRLVKLTYGGEDYALVEFDGTEDYVASSLFTVLPQPNTVVLVFEGPTALCTIIDAPMGTNARHRVQMATLPTGVGLQMMATNFAQPTPNTVPAGRLHLATLVYNDTNSILRLNGAAQTVNFANIGDAGMGGIQLGLKQDTNQSAPTGTPRIAEVLVFDRELTAQEMLDIEGWLVVRYGL